MECQKIKMFNAKELEPSSFYGRRHIPGEVINELPEIGSVGYLREKKCYMNRNRKEKYVPAVLLASGTEALVTVKGYTKSEVDPYIKGNRITVAYTTKNGYVGQVTYDTKLIGSGYMIFIKEEDGEKNHAERGSTKFHGKG